VEQAVIDGLKLTMTGVQLRSNLEARIGWHQSELRRMSKLLKTAHRDREECPYPDNVLEGEISRAERQIEVLSFIRDYIVADEIYRLGEFDLRFADLLPEDETWDCDCMPPGHGGSGAAPKVISEPH
jgi:hypothetical protein